MNLIPIRPNIIHNDPNKNHRFETGFVVGTDPPNKSQDHPSLPTQVATDPAFDFTWKSPGVYEWSNSLTAPGSNQSPITVDNCAFQPVYRKWDCGTTNTVTVSWKPGTDTIKVEGKIRYHGNEYWSSGNKDFENSRGRGLWYEGQNVITVDWDFDIVLVPDANQGSAEKCAVKPTFKRVELNLPSNFKPHYTEQYVTDGTGKKLSEQLQTQMKEVMAPAMKNIEAAFVNTGRFTYPGTRVLTFGPPEINDYGDIMSTINYKP